MTLEQRISAMVQLWRDAGQQEHAEALRLQMWQLLSPFLKANR